eukprot:gene25368-25510_t
MPSITVEPCTFALFGALGDLALRKLFPALYQLDGAGLLHADTRILALAREAGSEQQHLDHIEHELRKYVGQELDEAVAARFLARLAYVYVDFMNADDYVALAAKASQAAIDDAGGAGLAAHIDLIAAIRQFEVSTPRDVPPFGASNNFPRSVALRIGADPARAVLEVTGGQGPQHLVNEMAHAIAAGAVKMALLTGSEAISTVRHLKTAGETRDWAETLEGQLEDRGYGLEGLLTPEIANHGGRSAIQLYALFENARRGRLGLDRETYRGKMGELFAPFTKVAAGNPHAMSREVHDAAALATVT